MVNSKEEQLLSLCNSDRGAVNYDSVGDDNYNNRDDDEVLIMTTMMIKIILISLATSSKFFHPIIETTL